MENIIAIILIILSIFLVFAIHSKIAPIIKDKAEKDAKRILKEVEKMIYKKAGGE